MRKPPTKTKIATLQNTNTRSHQNQQRKVISKLTTKTLFDLVAQARNPLETEILNSGLDAMSSNELTVFFSFTDGSKRATVVHCSGKNLAEVWKKLASWQQKTYKKSPQARWLRVDWVTEKRLTSWADCLHQIQSVKRNYFRYGIALDTNFRYAFLEQELNANAMLYLGGSHSKAGLNKNNFLRYAVKRYGKHFSLPSSTQDPVMLFTTKAILVQPGKECEILYGYSGGKEGRNTGRRIINKLTPPTVKSLVQQASQFLAEQVDATGRFIYGLHPCFDREIKAYNTLRHTSTTYAMLEAWEVTQSPELKAAIDRSINHLTQDLIRQYKLPCGTAVAYLQDDNNEIKLGGSAVCLLALVKYTELTTDRHFLTLLEQLALGIEHMQNKENGQFTHVLHADDLSVKQTFRIIYYDGEAAFGLMRLYGLTKDPRWLQMVEKAFVYFIAQEHWKNHDHWLSYCVNELTLYRPEERYFQFGIQNVAGYLDFVIGRITTYPTLLELMMAAHKMIVRLKASDQHRHLLQQINLEKFYRALETRAHYLLNGFFWPEFAIYFQNPQRIMGSFFIRHHSFRVRIDDVEHYLSGYVAYLQHYLPKPGIIRLADATSDRKEVKLNPDLLFGKLPNIRIDIHKLRKHYQDHILSFPSIEYKDNQANYVGWAVTSDDGDIHSGVKQLQRGGPVGFIKTAICNGYLEEIVDTLRDANLEPFRCRIMKLVDGGLRMKFHADASIPYYRLHIALNTNESCKFQWLVNNKLYSTHIPADGSVYYVRVDKNHRAINTADSERVHFVCGTKSAAQKVIFEQGVNLDHDLEVQDATEENIA